VGEYRVGQVCLNGHAITDSADEYPELQEEFCSKCGAATTMACHRCKVPIRGHYHIENVFGGPEYSPPHYCHKCGNPYPWTEARLKTARDLADGLDDLSVEERERLKVSLEELARNAPSTEAAASEEAVPEVKGRKRRGTPTGAN
jgi:hypothetical protein